MPIETVTVAGKADPEMGKKRGRIKSQDGKLFQADPAYLRQVNVGGTYDVEYENREFNGATFRVVESIVPTMGHQQVSQRAQAQIAEGRASGQIMPDRRGEDIATLALVKEWMGRIPVGDVGAVVHALKSARAAWLKFKTGGDDKIESGPSLRDEMEDEIPEL